MGDFEFDFEGFEEAASSAGDESIKDELYINMIEVVDGTASFNIDGLYINSANLIQMIEKDIETYEEYGHDEEAEVLRDYMVRIQLMITGRNGVG